MKQEYRHNPATRRKAYWLKLERQMTTERKDGGPAFAALAVSAVGDVYEQTGLSLRDWFAGQALAGMHARDSYDAGLARPEQRAQCAYLDADAMLAARSKP